MNSALRLFIATDLKNQQWLHYLLEEFARSQQANFAIEICRPAEVPQDCALISYCRTAVSDIALPNYSHVNPNGEVFFIDPAVYVIPGTVSRNTRYTCPYDLFWNAFVFLSRLEEYLSETRGKKIFSYCRRHPRKDKDTFKIPVVSHLFARLERIIGNHFPVLSFGKPEQPVVELSHDVDYINKTLQLRLKQSAFNAYNTLKGLSNPLLFKTRAAEMLRFLGSNTSYWCFDYWRVVEQSVNMKSVFYIYARTSRKSLYSWLIDPSYDIISNRRLVQTLKALTAEGFEIGLHGSYRSAVDLNLMAEEKKVLETALGTVVNKIRQHWLRYEESITPFLHNRLFQYDSSLGWNDRIGFRSGCVFRYRPYNHWDQKPFEYEVTPQVVMDANLFEYGFHRKESILAETIHILDSLKSFRNAYVSISWHQRGRSADYQWHKAYEMILQRLSSSPGGTSESEVTGVDRNSKTPKAPQDVETL